MEESGFASAFVSTTAETLAAIERDAAATAGRAVESNPAVQAATATSATALAQAEAQRLTNQRLLQESEAAARAQSQSSNNEVATSRGQATNVRTDNNNLIPKDQRTTKGRPNPLDNYANVTYGLSLHVIPRDVYNNLVNNTTKYVPKNTVLIASGGRSDQNFSYDEFFNRADFYIENLKFETIIGMNSRSRSSNVISFNFTIVEPIGMTLLNRLLQVANKYKYYNWGQMPFMLQVDFFANTDSGTPTKIQTQTKFLPIKLIDCKIKVSTRGAEYNCTAVPYSHQAYNESAASSPASFEVHADSVGNFFDSAADIGYYRRREDIAKAAQENIEAARQQQSVASAEGDRSDRLAAQGRVTQAKREAVEASQAPWRINSFASALNANQAILKQRNYQEVTDEFYFFIDKEIADAKLVLPERNPTRQSSIRRLDQADALRATFSKSNATITTKEQALGINAGTSVIDIIDMVIRNSSYITDQIKADQPNKIEKDKPIKWFKITCKVELKEFDQKRKVQAKIYTYFITRYDYYNTKYPETTRSIPSQWEKSYSYSYTGQNQSIIDFNLDFNVAFFTAMTAMRESEKSIEPGPTNTTYYDAADPISLTQSTGDQSQGTISPNQIRPVTYIGETRFLTAGQNDKVNASANDLRSSIMSNSRGDMINVQLKIAGDPEFIKQDDLFFNPSTQTKVTSLDQNNGSLIMDASEIFTYLLFKIPTDINQDTGLVEYKTTNSAGKVIGDSVFNGVYKVIRVENNFDRGAFTQTLDLIRLFGQDETAVQDTNNRGDSANGAGTAQKNDADWAQLAKLQNQPASITVTVAQSNTLVNESPAALTESSEVAAQLNNDLRNILDNVQVAKNITDNNNGIPWVADRGIG